MRAVPRKRAVSSCIPCYTRKQKCSRECPCNHCNRRGRPEDCTYFPSRVADVNSPPVQQTAGFHSEYKQNGSVPLKESVDAESLHVGFRLGGPKGPSATTQSCLSPLAEAFGYSNDSKYSIMILLQRQLGLQGERQRSRDQIIPRDVAAEVQQTLAKIPERPILDFLVRYFLSEVNWIDQLVYIPSFSQQYKQWRSIKGAFSVDDIEFTVLLLRICSYASLFLPSPSYTIEKVRGMLLADIRTTCDKVGDHLALTCSRLDSRGSLVRVQHLCFMALKAQCEGRARTFWTSLGCAIQVAQRIGLDRDVPKLASDIEDEAERESWHRVFCNLYIWDSNPLRQLDRTNILPDPLSTRSIGHLVSNTSTASGSGFTALLLRARLAHFWRSITSPKEDTQYDLLLAEARYEKFCKEFLPSLPPSFALQQRQQQSNKPGDEFGHDSAKLPLQREILHISIYTSICYNFQPVLLQDPSHVRSLPKYKQILLSSQEKALALAALKVLEGVSTLHAMMGLSQTRFPGIISPAFEAAVLLACLCIGRNLSRETEGGSDQSATGSPVEVLDPLKTGMVSLNREQCMHAVQETLYRLQTLEEVSTLAEVGVQTLAQLVAKAVAFPACTQDDRCRVVPTSESSRQGNEAWSEMHLPEFPEPIPLPGLNSNLAFDSVDINWEELDTFGL